MIKEFIGTGKTVEEATAAAKTGLNAPAMADINIEVIVMPKSKVLGLFGGRDAQVKAWYNDTRKEKKQKPKKENAAKNTVKKEEKKPQQKKDAPKKERPAQKNAQANAPKAQKEAKADSAVKAEPMENEEAIEKITAADVDTNVAVAYLGEILKGLKVEDANITACVADGALQMEIDCEDYGIIIGRRGETLDSLQYLTGLAVKKSCDKYVRVVINVGNYREKRTETLRNLARKNANYVLRTGRRYTFEPMNPYERRIIHTTIQEIDGVDSLSIGYGQDRRVVLQSTDGPRSRRGGNSAPAKRTAAPKSDRADLPKFGKIEVNKDE